MFRDVMGDDAFWSGLREYLDKYKYDNVGQEDLFKIMEKHSRRRRVCFCTFTNC